MKLTRYLLPVLCAILVAFAFSIPVFAIDDPDSLSINAVYAYRNCRENGDQLYLIDYTIEYLVLPAETAYEAYMARFYFGGTAIKTVSIYPFHDKGYGDGVIAIYFHAHEAPTWMDDSIEIVLEGNPFESWAAAAPEDTMEDSEFSVWQDNPLSTTKHVVSSRIFAMASDLEVSWAVTMVITTTDDGRYLLTPYGLAYFSGVVPYLSEVAPYVYAPDTMPTVVIAPDIPDITSGTGYADYLESLIIGTPFDLTPVATAFGVDRGPLTALLYYAMVMVFVILAVRRIGSYKPVMLFSLPFVILGAFVGVPLIVTILAGFLSLGFTSYALFYKGSTA